MQVFNADKFAVSAKVAKVSAGLSEESGTPTGNAVLAVLFDNGGVNRIEWILTTEGRFEAWVMRDGTSERIDGKNLATKEKSPTLGIGRRGDDYLFYAQRRSRSAEKNQKSSLHFSCYALWFWNLERRMGNGQHNHAGTKVNSAKLQCWIQHPIAGFKFNIQC